MVLWTFRNVALAALVVLPAVTTGCATSLSASASPGVDTTGHFGGEGRLQVSAAAGDPGLRFFVALAGGAGHLDSLHSGYATVSPEVGVEGGRAITWSAGALYTPRILFDGPPDVAHGGGVAGHVLFRLKRTGGEKGGLLLGPRLSIEGLDRGPSPPGQPSALALFQLGLVLRWLTFDTTGNSW